MWSWNSRKLAAWTSYRTNTHFVHLIPSPFQLIRIVLRFYVSGRAGSYFIKKIYDIL